MLGKILVTRPFGEIEELGGDPDGLGIGCEVVVSGVDCEYVYIDGETYTLEPDGHGLSWKTFFTAKEL